MYKRFSIGAAWISCQVYTCKVIQQADSAAVSCVGVGVTTNTRDS